MASREVPCPSPNVAFERDATIRYIATRLEKQFARSPIVAAFIRQLERGQPSIDVLIGCIEALEEQNAAFLDIATRKAMREPPQPFVMDGKKFTPLVIKCDQCRVTIGVDDVRASRNGKPICQECGRLPPPPDVRTENGQVVANRDIEKGESVWMAFEQYQTVMQQDRHPVLSEFWCSGCEKFLPMEGNYVSEFTQGKLICMACRRKLSEADSQKRPLHAMRPDLWNADGTAIPCTPAMTEEDLLKLIDAKGETLPRGTMYVQPGPDRHEPLCTCPNARLPTATGQYCYHCDRCQGVRVSIATDFRTEGMFDLATGKIVTKFEVNPTITQEKRWFAEQVARIQEGMDEVSPTFLPAPDAKVERI